MLLAITHHNGVRIAELGFALSAIAGGAFVIGAIDRPRVAWRIVAGAALAAGSVLLIVAAHWGHYG